MENNNVPFDHILYFTKCFILKPRLYSAEYSMCTYTSNLIYKISQENIYLSETMVDKEWSDFKHSYE